MAERRHPELMSPRAGTPWKSAGRFLLRRLRPSGGRSWDGNAGLPELLVRGVAARPRRLRRYLATTGGLEIEPLAGALVLPPTFPALWETGYLLDLLRLAGFPLPTGGIIHLGGERLQLRPLAALEPAQLHLALRRVEAAPRGVSVEIASVVSDLAGRPALEGEMHLLLRGIPPQGRPPGRPERPRSHEPEPPAAGWRTLRRWKLPASLGRRYALASGDINPIHLSRLTARLFGFPRPILHGYCTEALTAHALIEGPLGGDPTALARLAIRFGAPLGLPAEAALEVAEAPGGESGWFRVSAPGQQGGPHYAAGRWVGGPAPGAGPG